jgi:AcrR family transcriptional regulator
MRPRTERAVLDAAAELLSEGGVPLLTIEGVAARSGVAKTTIYRRWRDRDELALAVLVETTEHNRAPADVGDTRKELLTFVQSATKIIHEHGIVRGLASRIATDPKLAEIYRERVVELRRSEAATVIERGIARGDFRSDLDVRVVHELLVGPLFYRLLFSGARLTKAHAEMVVDAVMRAFAP